MFIKDNLGREKNLLGCQIKAPIGLIMRWKSEKDVGSRQTFELLMKVRMGIWIVKAFENMNDAIIKGLPINNFIWQFEFERIGGKSVDENYYNIKCIVPKFRMKGRMT